jgi:branched-chain amino acid transport system permease protein
MLRSKSLAGWASRIHISRPSLSQNQDFLLAIVVLVLISIGLLLFYPEPYVLTILTLSLTYCIVVLGYNLVLTVSGLFHLGFSVHFAIGAYIAAILMARYGWETLPAAVAVIAGSALITGLISIPALRFIGDYLSIVTLAFAEIVRQILLNWKEVTNGSNGIFGIPRPIFFGFTNTSPSYLYAVIAVIALLALISYYALISSRIGLAWEAIRLNEDAARAMGIRIKPFKYLCLIIGSLFAGIGGLCYAHFASITDPSMSSFDVTLILITIMILGGGSTFGILIASVVMTAIPQLFLSFALYRQVAVGLFIVAIANWRPEGLSLLRKQGYARFRKSPSISISSANESQELLSSDRDKKFAVEVVGAVKRFGGLEAVSDLSLNVPYGSIFGIIGPNGAGKTTLFNLISGVYPLNEGSVRIFGQDVTNWPEWRVARLGVGRTFQNIKLFKKLTVLDNVLFASAIPTYSHIMNRSQWNDAIDVACAALEFVRLEERANVLAGALPYGEQRRLEIARALAIQPHLLLLDEPSAGMNPIEREDLANLVQDIRKVGMSVVCIEHNMPFILPIADEILVMAEGKCLTQGKPENVTNDPAVIEAYLGRRTARVAGN